MTRRIHELRAVVLADVERVDADGVGENRLLERVTDHLVTADRLPRLIDRHRKERVETKFEFVCGHLVLSARFGFKVTYHDGTIPLW